MSMPGKHHQSRSPRAATAAVAVLAFAASVAFSQQAAESPKAGALKLPDGTVVLYTATPEAPDPPVGGVLLSGKEYQDLLEQAALLRKQKTSGSPPPPSRCEIVGRVEAAGGRPVAALSAVYSFRTTTPRASISLGGRRGLPRSARWSDGSLPLLNLGEDGLTVVAEHPGEHVLTVEYEVPVTARGGNKESGFDIGLPRAPVTTFTFDPAPEGKTFAVGTRTPDRPGEVQRSPYRAGAALGPTDLLDVSWEQPAAAGPTGEPERVAESDVLVRVESERAEIVAKMRLSGPGEGWRLLLPPGAEVTAERATATTADPSADPITIVRPEGPGDLLWTIQVPDETATEWVVTAVVRLPRPTDDPRQRVTYPIGPFAVPGARHHGTVRVFAPASVGLRFRPEPGVRRVETPTGPADPIALFQFALGETAGAERPSPLLEVEARPSVGFLRIEPAYRLRLSPSGWAMTADLTITPVRSEVEDIRVELPTGWQGVEASGRRAGADAAGELVGEAEVTSDGDGPRELLIRLTSPQKSPFVLTLGGVYPVPAGSREATIPLPAYPQGSVEQNARLTAEVPSGLEVRGTAVGRDRNRLGETVDMRPTAAASTEPSPAVALAAGFERGVGRASLAWQPFRPEISARVEVEVNLHERQATIVETVYLSAEAGAWRETRFRGPAAATPTLNAPLLRPAGEAEWQLTPQADTGRESPPIVLTYSLPIPPNLARLDLGVFWPEVTGRVESRVRVWGGPGVRRVIGFDGPWVKMAPEPDEGRDSLPWMTVAGTGTGAKLGIQLAETSDGPLPAVWVDGVVYRAWIGEGAVTLRGSFQLRRWPASGVDLIVPAGTDPEVTVDGRRSDNLITVAWPADGPWVYRVPVPEPKPGRDMLTLEIGYPLPAPSRAVATATITPPILARAAELTPARWQVFGPTGSTPLLPGHGLRPEIRWVWRGLMATPTAGGDRPLWPGEFVSLIAGVQPTPGPLTVYLIPRAGWLAVCSMAALVLILGISQLRPVLLGPAVALVGLAIAAAAITWPQPTAEVVGAAQPGVWIAAVVLAVQFGLLWYHRYRTHYLPGFSRTLPDTALNGIPPTPLSVPSAGGQSGSIPVPLSRAGAVGSSGSGRA